MSALPFLLVKNSHVDYCENIPHSTYLQYAHKWKFIFKQELTVSFYFSFYNHISSFSKFFIISLIYVSSKIEGKDIFTSGFITMNYNISFFH